MTLSYFDSINIQLKPTELDKVAILFPSTINISNPEGYVTFNTCVKTLTKH